MLTIPKAKCADMMAAGVQYKEIAEALDVSQQTISKWSRDPDVIEQYRKVMARQSFTLYAKAMQVLEEQLYSSNLWIRQDAARELATRLHDVATGDARDIVIRLEGSPMIGLPSSEIDSIE